MLCCDDRPSSFCFEHSNFGISQGRLVTYKVCVYSDVDCSCLSSHYLEYKEKIVWGYVHLFCQNASHENNPNIHVFGESFGLFVLYEYPFEQKIAISICGLGLGIGFLLV